MNAQEASPAPRRRRWVIVIPIVLAIVALAGIYWLLTRGWVATNDAQVEGNLVPISPRVNGYVDRIYVDDNQQVSAEQILVRLDSRDLETRVRAAEANLALQSSQEAAAAAQVPLVKQTATAGQQQAGAGVSAAGAGVASSTTQIVAAEAQAAAAQANADAARDAVAGAASDVESAREQTRAARAGLQAAQASLTSAQAQAQRAAADADRFQQLYRQGAISKQQLDAAVAANISAQAAAKSAREGVRSASAAVGQAQARERSAQAGLTQSRSRAASAQALADQARAAVKTARTAYSQARARLSQAQAAEAGARTVPQQVAISHSQHRAAVARAHQAAADLRNARLQLSYTLITAPVSGVVSQKTVEPGQSVQPGQLLMSLVPLQKVWVVANFKETQIGDMRAGQPATIEVDTYPGLELHARVDSVGAATGAKFSILPPENATGNFVKVVQRIPVKLVFDRPFPRGVVLRPGLNVVARVRVAGG